MRTTKALALVTALLSLLSPIGCFGIEDVDRTQANRVRKSVFEGEWIYHQTVIGVPYATWFTFIGEQTEKSERVRWDVQEDFLIAYRTYDLVDFTDSTAHLPGDHNENTPIAIFPIMKHFDVQRSYNAQTGEQYNVLQENDFDKHWYERQWMRVDWSQNLAPSFNFLVGQVEQTPGSHFVQKPGDPDSLLFGVKNGGAWIDHQSDSIATLESADYIDIVHRVMAAPATIEFEDWYDGQIYSYPACWFYYNVDCAPAEVTIRSAFLKADANDPYVAKDYPDNKLERDADGDPVTVAYESRDDLTPDPDGFEVRTPYFDKFGFFRTEREAFDRRYGETQSGQTFLINRFNIWQDAPGCVDDASATPYADCTVEPIVYFLSRGFPADLRDDAQLVADQWNEAFQEVVRALKYGDDRSFDEVEDVVILRDNTWSVDAEGATQNRGQRMGDIRYSQIVWVDQPDQAGLLGYGPAAIDPVSGQILSASAFVYGAGVDGYAQYGHDIVEITNDPSLLDTYLDHGDVTSDVHTRRITDENARSRTRDFVRNKVNTPRNKSIKSAGLRALKRDPAETRARLEAVRDTPLEQLLMSDRVLRAFGGATGPDTNNLTAGQRHQASPTSWAMGQAARREKFRQGRLASRNIMHSRAFDPSVIGLAQDLRDLPPDEAYAEIRSRVFRATTEHEVGHNLGLRHNFEASTDALNYGQQYWDLKGSGAQALEAPSQAQIDAGMRRHQYSSIMDYGSRFVSDVEGLQSYDRAAIAFGYGDLVEVFEDASAIDDLNLLEMYFLDDIVRHFRHYTKLPEMFGGVDAMHQRRFVPYQQIIDQNKGETTWDMWEVPYRFCSDEYEGATGTCAVFDEGADPYEIALSAHTLYKEYLPFLSFSRDQRYFSEWDYMSSVYFRTWWPMLTQYQNWVFDSYSWEADWDCIRDDVGCDLDATVDDPIYYGVENVPWAEAGDAGLSGAAATRLLLDGLGEVVAMPEPGSYYYDSAEDVMLVYSYDEDTLCPPGNPGPACSELNVPFGTGRWTDSYWAAETGYYFYDRLSYVGSFYDKLMALETVVSSGTYFLGVNSSAQLDQFAIGLNLFFPEEVYRIVGGASSEDYPSFAGRICDATQVFEPPVFSDPAHVFCDGNASRPVDPATSFTVELYAIWYGMAFLQDSFDTNFNDRIKIWLEGSGEQITVTDPALLATFVNPLNNRTYHASRAPNGGYSPGAALLTRAQRFADAYNLDPVPNNRYLLEALVSTIEDVRGTYDIYGYFWF